MHSNKTIHLGTFEGEAKAAASGWHEPGSLLKDVASLLSTVAFCAAVAFVLVASVVPELPA